MTAPHVMELSFFRLVPPPPFHFNHACSQKKCFIFTSFISHCDKSNLICSFANLGALFQIVPILEASNVFKGSNESTTCLEWVCKVNLENLQSRSVHFLYVITWIHPEVQRVLKYCGQIKLLLLFYFGCLSDLFAPSLHYQSLPALK